MSGKSRKIVIILAVVAVVIAVMMAGTGWISSRAYFRTSARLHSALPAELQTKYGEELEYTIDKFWKCYEEGICSRNDMTDVMDYMQRLITSGEISDSDIFEFLGFVSRIYTDRLDDHHRDEIRRMEEERESGQ